ncbi:MAG TPA: phosphoribosyltransferase family protein [Candidatus Saccharimonadales bacterium]
MYFSSRLQAGRMLASRLSVKYRYENCAVVALNDGGVVVGAQIAQQLHCILNMIISEEINLPREPIAVGGITSDGNFSYNPEYSGSEIDEIMAESRGTIEEQKLTKIHEMNRMTSGGLVNKKLLVGQNIILVSDGLKSPFSLDVALQFLKPIRIEKLIIATPLASVKTVDWMHLYADEIFCLSVIDDYIDTDHYYDNNDVPDRETIIKTIETVILNWK